MHITMIHLSALLSPKGNPRKSVDTTEIARLAQSIRNDGLLQNLVVRPEGEEKYRVVSGKRRYLALQLLKKEGAIDGTYDVPVEVRDELSDDEALRLATVENVHREQLHILDEAEAYAKLLQNGGTIEAIVETTGFAALTVKRRLALASLCTEAKRALRAGAISRGIAETLTLGSHGQQRQLLKDIDADGLPEAEELRDLLLNQKPSVALAIFPRRRYEGSLTTDLFADESTTYFDDVDQFLALQKQAVEELAEEYRAKASFVEVLEVYSLPWWQYRETEDGEAGGVVIHLHPSGAVEVREGLVRQPVEERVAEATRDAPTAPRPRPVFSAPLLRYAACHRTVAVQAALLRNPRKAKEVVAQLFLCRDSSGGVALTLHHAHRNAREFVDALAYREIGKKAGTLADRLALARRQNDGGGDIDRLILAESDGDLHDTLAGLSDEELDHLLLLLPILCFGQAEIEKLDAGAGLFNRVAEELQIDMRDWWTPDVAFLASLRREQLIAVAQASGAVERLGGVGDWSKTELVQALVRYFAALANSDADGCDKGRRWLPGPMRFPASEDLGS